ALVTNAPASLAVMANTVERCMTRDSARVTPCRSATVRTMVSRIMGQPLHVEAQREERRIRLSMEGFDGDTFGQSGHPTPLPGSRNGCEDGRATAGNLRHPQG